MHGSKDQHATDQQQVHDFLTGQTEVLEELARRYTPLLERTLIGRGADPAEAEDVVAKLWADCLDEAGAKPSLLAKYKGTASLENWLRTVATRRYIDVQRRRRHLSYTLPPEDSLLLRDQADAGPAGQERENLTRLMHDCLRRAVASCAPQEQLLLRLVHLHGLTQREVCRMWHLHESTISRMLTQASARIRKRTLHCIRQTDPWLELDWKDFLELCQVETLL